MNIYAKYDEIPDEAKTKIFQTDGLTSGKTDGQDSPTPPPPHPQHSLQGNKKLNQLPLDPH